MPGIATEPDTTRGHGGGDRAISFTRIGQGHNLLCWQRGEPVGTRRGVHQMVAVVRPGRSAARVWYELARAALAVLVTDGRSP